jgi:hypothetical protein
MVLEALALEFPSRFKSPPPGAFSKAAQLLKDCSNLALPSFDSVLTVKSATTAERLSSNNIELLREEKTNEL